MIAPIQFAEPLPATHETTNTPCLVYGVADQVLVQMDNGKLLWLPLDEVNIDFRFNYRRGTWDNTSLMTMGEIDGDDEEDDRGEGVPDAVSYPDGVGDSDQGDEADHDPRDMDTGEDAP